MVVAKNFNTNKGRAYTSPPTKVNKMNKKLSDYEKLEWLHFAISEAINGNIGELSNALEIVEQLREPHLEENN